MTRWSWRRRPRSSSTRTCGAERGLLPAARDPPPPGAQTVGCGAGETLGVAAPQTPAPVQGAARETLGAATRTPPQGTPALSQAARRPLAPPQRAPPQGPQAVRRATRRPLQTAARAPPPHVGGGAAQTVRAHERPPCPPASRFAASLDAAAHPAAPACPLAARAGAGPARRVRARRDPVPPRLPPAPASTPTPRPYSAGAGPPPHRAPPADSQLPGQARQYAPPAQEVSGGHR